MNKFIGTGNLTKDIEVRMTTSGVAVLSNSIAMRNDYKNAKGEYDSTFINFVAYRNNAEFLNKYASKGSKVLIEGRLNNRSYDKQDGTKAYITEVIADKVELLGTPTKKEETPNNNQMKEEPKQEPTSDPFAEFGQENEIELSNLDLPF